mmetsp:Transcript_37788/g.27839  ORF Transcript_37788/g.27839 Transcript_37788/m.27839 type:complete len:127 (+) Transcript_37788:329-709(+)
MKETYGLELRLSREGFVTFPYQERWLKGEEYGFLLRHYRTYVNALKEFDCYSGVQPASVYDQPYNGMFYFIKGMHLREFGFPRQKDLDNLQKLKLFKWKKTNFVTDLPKHQPVIRYLVAKSKVSAT